MKEEITPSLEALRYLRPTFTVASALRRAFQKGYGARELRADVLAGVVVGIVALPLSMALAIAVGAPPQHGLYTAIVAGVVVALLGGCKFQVTGPTAAFVVILAPILTKYGIGGLMTAGFMAGIVLVVMGALRVGRLIEFIPHPVTTGFTTGIATVIATLQIKDVLGLKVAAMPEHYTDKLLALWSARATFDVSELAVSVVTFSLLLVVPKVTKRVPAPLIALALVTLAATILHRFVPSFSVATIGTRFHTTIEGVEVAGIPRMLPSPSLPWEHLSFGLIRDLFPSALAIAMLGAIESLLSAVIADGMTGTKHDPNAELLALGVGNIVVPIFGGIAATGALARTATNIRGGAKSPLSSVTHAIVVLLSMIILAPLVAYVPMASLAALLVLVAWNMSEIHGFLHVIRVAPKSDIAILLTCYTLTVLFDMVVAVEVGVVLAAMLFMRRMAELTESRTFHESMPDTDADETTMRMPKGVALYEVNGPLFFGAAANAMGAIHAVRTDAFHTMILHLGRVPVIDATGLVALENAIDRLQRDKKRVVLTGPLPRPAAIWQKAKLAERFAGLVIASNLDAALESVSVKDPTPSTSGE